MNLTEDQAASLNYLKVLGIDVWLPKTSAQDIPRVTACDTPSTSIVKPLNISTTNKTLIAPPKKPDTQAPSLIKFEVTLHQLSSDVVLIAELTADNEANAFDLTKKIGQAIKHALGVTTEDAVHSLKWPNPILTTHENTQKDVLAGFLAGKGCLAKGVHWILLGDTLEPLIQDPTNANTGKIISEQTSVFKLIAHENRYALYACSIQRLLSDRQAKASLWQGIKTFLRLTHPNNI